MMYDAISPVNYDAGTQNVENLDLFGHETIVFSFRGGGLVPMWLRMVGLMGSSATKGYVFPRDVVLTWVAPQDQSVGNPAYKIYVDGVVREFHAFGGYVMLNRKVDAGSYVSLEVVPHPTTGYSSMQNPCVVIGYKYLP
jgi:hypothetical protein